MIARAMSTARIPAEAFYKEYHGHQVGHLEPLVKTLRANGAQSFIYLAGDSTLDNKHWLFKYRGSFREETSAAAAINGYEKALDPPIMLKDVSYWINHECSRAQPQAKTPCINCAVEESCIVQREVGGLLDQDKFIRDNLREEDVLVVDMGGNDVALRPTCWLIVHMAWLLYLTPTCLIRCGPFLAPGLWYFIYMFRVRLRRIIEKLTAKTKPKKIIVCMLYYLDETPGGSWADGTLQALGYNTNPDKLQTVMRQVYSWGVSQLSIPDVTIVPLPLYEVLDGKDTTDYVARVEPSEKGGQKMGKAIAEAILAQENE
mmetsp:Transcript_46148/g.107847  ORF Transcript_46148/g.107847 Transcript_46148/m.107847 type:complete len:316 (-) Transcript_46148:91-1038(-)